MIIKLNTWSDTQWKSHIDSVEAVQYQVLNIREAFEVRPRADWPPGVPGLFPVGQYVSGPVHQKKKKSFNVVGLAL